VGAVKIFFGQRWLSPPPPGEIAYDPTSFIVAVTLLIKYAFRSGWLPEITALYILIYILISVAVITE